MNDGMIACTLRLVALCSLLTRYAFAQDGYQAGVTLSPNERMFAVGNCDDHVGLFRVRDGKRVRTFRSEERFLTKPVFSPDGKYLTAGNLDPDAGVNPVWSAATGKVVARLAVWGDRDNSAPMGVLGFTGDGKYLLGVTQFGSKLVAFRRPDWQLAFIRDTQNDSSPLAAVRPVGSVVISLPSREAGFDVWDPLRKYESPWPDWPIERPKGVAYMSFSRDGHVLALAGDGWVGTVDHRDLPKAGEWKAYRPRKTSTVKDFVIRSLCLSANGRSAFIGARDGRIAQFDIKSGKCLRTWKAFNDPVKGLTLTRKGDLLFSYDLFVVRIWNVASGKLVREIRTDSQKKK